MEITTRRTAAALALVLGIATASAAFAATAPAPVAHELTAVDPTGTVLAAEATPEAVPAVSSISSAPVYAPRIVETAQPPVVARTTSSTTVKAASVTAKETKTATGPQAKPAKVTRSKAPTSSTTRSSGTSHTPKVTTAADYSGTNHVWIPSLGINRSVHWFSCDRAAPPDEYMYRWGCAGSNNIYLMGHAYAAMKPLHDAYVGGHLRVGMKAYYADAKGQVHTYAVKWWKITRPTTDAAWAWAAQSTPSMTLQTCVGANSQYRLMVRLVEIDG